MLCLQVVIVAIDVNPRTLINHVILLCTSRGVPILPVSGGDGCGSLRLGELLGTRTAIAIGIKVSAPPPARVILPADETVPKHGYHKSTQKSVFSDSLVEEPFFAFSGLA